MSSEKPTAADFFDDIVGHYDQAIYRCVPRYDEMLEQMLAYVPNPNPQSILELGSGTGNLTFKVLERYPAATVTSVDASPEMINITRKRFDGDSRLVLSENKFENLEFEDNSFDLIVSSISIHHLDDEQKLVLFRKTGKWLCEGGVFTFCDQFAGETDFLYLRHMDHWKQASMAMGATQQEWDDWMEHQQAHDFHSPLSTHLNLLREAGFTSIDCTRRYFLWTTMIGCV